MKIGLLPLLATLFIGLKLAHVIDWSWWLVLIPIWIMLMGYGCLFMSMVILETIKKLSK